MRGKSLKRELSVTEMLHMREMGMTNKQIANQLDVSVSTIYQWIGRRSEAVKHAEVQRKACPIPNPMHFETKTDESELPAVETKENGPVEAEEETKVKDEEMIVELKKEAYTSMPVLKRREIVDLQGTSCCYRVDTGDKTVEMIEGEAASLVTGLLDKDSLFAFIRELMQVWRMLGGNSD